MKENLEDFEHYRDEMRRALTMSQFKPACFLNKANRLLQSLHQARLCLSVTVADNEIVHRVWSRKQGVLGCLELDFNNGDDEVSRLVIGLLPEGIVLWNADKEEFPPDPSESQISWRLATSSFFKFLSDHASDPAIA